MPRFIAGTFVGNMFEIAAQRWLSRQANSPASAGSFMESASLDKTAVRRRFDP